MSEQRIAPWSLATADAGGGDVVFLVVGDRALPLGAAARMPDAPPLPEGAGDIPTTTIDLLRNWDVLEPWLDGVARRASGDDGALPRLGHDASNLRFRAPVPQPGQLLYAAANYRAHILEQMRTLLPEGSQEVDKRLIRPYFFPKPATSVTGPFDDVAIPPDVTQLDWEVELALVIGRAGFRISEREAMQHVAGYMVADDLTCRDMVIRRDWPLLRTDWLTGKGFPGFAPLGPYLVPARFVPDPLNLRLQLRVNGETKQDSSTAEMVFSPAEQIAFVSRVVPLAPGDVISTGTPEGVGFASGTFLAAGDVVEAEVEGLGRQRTRIVDSAKS
ncbi:MAG: fumarylacetoacetate hydrolase family protein [Candidatus Dormibacteraeota bacterium]|nr:fumarylacetoacetate hydrolase family protein [Candidatus Dormibacteraeota bacterium]MBV9525078.1 fumarylacetoacetate hydrolase family protein [Candidatus Dormibacteraeota bacterium]